MKQRALETLLGLGLILLSLTELLVETKHGVEKYGYLGGALFGIYYVHKAYKAHLFRERDKVWMAMYIAIGEAVGAKWNADTLKVIERHLTEVNKTGFTSFWAEKSPVRSARPRMISNMRRVLSMEKLKSRKFWLAIVGALVPVINQEFGLDLDSNTVLAMIGVLSVGIAALAHVDGKKAANGGASNAEPNPSIQSAK